VLFGESSGESAHQIASLNLARIRLGIKIPVRYK